MRGSVIRRVVLLAVSVALVAPAGLVAGAAAGEPPAATTAGFGALPPDVVRAGLAAHGRVVRRETGLTVESVTLPAALRTAHPSLADPLYRVRVTGAFPARALRYDVLAGGRLVGYGVPAPSAHAIRTVTADPSVRTAVITTSYGEALPIPPASGGSVSAPAGAHVRRGRLPDPATGGPYAVTREIYNLGKQVFQPSEIGGKVELIGDVFYPRGLPDGPYPLVLFMHGNHYSCYKPSGDVDYTWPCPEGWRMLPNYAGYDYIARRLASYGYIVASISANGVNVLGNSVGDTGMRQRGELMEKHIDLWNDWNSSGGAPFGSRFVGKVDMDQIGTMGHSRGGEGVVWNEIVDRERPQPYGIDAVLALAPVDFTRATINDVPFAVMLPYCDGDVSDLQGIHYFDDSRYLVPGDHTPKSSVTVFGANHNFFNTVWSPSGGFPGASDDGSFTQCSGRLTQMQERRVGAAYIVGFFRRYVGGETAFDPMWTGADAPGSIAPARTLVSYLAPDTPARRMDVDRFVDTSSLATTQDGGAVTATRLGAFGWCADTYALPCVPGNLGFYDRHLPGLGQGVVGWSGEHGVVRFQLPAGSRDVRGFDAFQFRAVVNAGYDVNRSFDYQDLAVALIDGNGDEADVLASEVGNEPLRYPIEERGGGHILMNQLRFPLHDFEGIDLSDIRAVKLRFSRTPYGVIDLADAAFSAGAH
jgi:hypothetical protein